MRLVVRADAGAAIGGGHVMRCGVLCKVLAELGWDITIAAREGTRRLASALDSLATGWLTLDGDLPTEPAAMKLAWPDGIDLLIVDHYEWSAELESACRGWARQIMVMDDMADRPRDADIILNTTPGIVRTDYDGLIPETAKLLAGPAFALVSEAFSRIRTMTPPTQHQKGRSAIFVNYGLSDPVNATTVALEAIESLDKDFSTQVVIGAACQHAESIAEVAARIGAVVRVNPPIDRIAQMMERATLAMGAAGTASWERCCLGLPAIISVTAENQKPNAEALADSGAASVLPHGKTLDRDAMANTLKHHLEDTKFNAEMAQRAALLCDGLGARRVAMALTPVHTVNGAPITLRPAVISDGDIMLAWQQHPATRAHAINPEIPGREEHFSWLKAKLNDPACLFSLIEQDHRPAGVLRLDQNGADSYVISILVAPDLHGQGIGRAALTLARQLIPWATIHAIVLPENKASHALFLSAGYVLHGDQYVSLPLASAA